MKVLPPSPQTLLTELLGPRNENNRDEEEKCPYTFLRSLGCIYDSSGNDFDNGKKCAHT